MRITDWNSDVCSSDLAPSMRQSIPPAPRNTETRLAPSPTVASSRIETKPEACSIRTERISRAERASSICVSRLDQPSPTRSEEHTSELQSLMRHSSAVFCFKQKKTQHNIIHIITNTI